MTAPHAKRSQGMPRPACTPAAIRAVLAANADNDVLRQCDGDLDVAFEQAREQGDLTPLVQTVRRWWFEADAWRDPEAQREFLARIDTYRSEGLPPAEQRMTREEIRAPQPRQESHPRRRSGEQGGALADRFSASLIRARRLLTTPGCERQGPVVDDALHHDG
jgi:hypothetical protein